MEQIGFLDLGQTSSRPNSDITGFNQDGREFAVMGVYDGIQYQGNYTISWDASNYSSGVYFIKMNVGYSQAFISNSQKLVLLK